MPEIRVGQRARLTRRVLGQTEGTKVVVLLYLGEDAPLPKYPYRDGKVIYANGWAFEPTEVVAVGVEPGGWLAVYLSRPVGEGPLTYHGADAMSILGQMLNARMLNVPQIDGFSAKLNERPDGGGDAD